MAAKAICFQEALQPSFATYAKQVVLNAKALAKQLQLNGAHLVTGGTDNHLILLDVEKSFGMTGKQAEKLCHLIGITLNRNTIPRDPNGPWHTSGIRLGTPALTTRGLKEPEMKKIANIVCHALKKGEHALQKEGATSSDLSLDPSDREHYKNEVQQLLKDFPLYGEIYIE